MPTLDELRATPNALARHYSAFRVGERLLLTGHSHQAWPDVAREGALEAWDDAAAHADEKWGRAMARADRVRRGFAERIGARPGEIALGASTHELVVRFLSALPLRDRPRLVTTDGEFHTIRRQLDRIAELGSIQVVRVAAEPVDSLAERLAAEVTARTAAVLVSSVLFASARIVPGLHHVMRVCAVQGARLLVDAYHQVNVVPLHLGHSGLAGAFVVGGGYKYCQLGEGNAFLRVPQGGAQLRPVVTGWYGEFDSLSSAPGHAVRYGEGPERWAGATYDPTSHYRAARVFDLHDALGLTPPFLREVSQHQIRLLAKRFDELDLDPLRITRDRDTPLERFGGFLALRAPWAGATQAQLRARGVLTDYRGDVLRLGPSPYLSDAQLGEAVRILGEVVRGS